MTKEVIQFLKGIRISPTDSIVDHIDDEAPDGAEVIVRQRLADLRYDEDHQFRFSQWAAHRLAGRARGYSACLRAAARLWLAYAGWEYADPAKVGDVAWDVISGRKDEVSDAVAKELALLADYHGYNKIAKAIRLGQYTAEMEVADSVRDKMLTICQRRHW